MRKKIINFKFLFIFPNKSKFKEKCVKKNYKTIFMFYDLFHYFNIYFLFFILVLKKFKVVYVAEVPPSGASPCVR